ncbi:uncharacterized protein LOC143436480 [Arvicanthis niloticus]|uniref:uncharacterized protein LOC117696750 n=1 Tax=Arvicanthis niloticus TaxID=61156 RepID=UPI00148621AA|nr:5E5 antigen-like [Arvicanthis niloticus]
MTKRGASRAGEGRTQHRGSGWSPPRETRRRRRRLHIWRPGRARLAHRPLAGRGNLRSVRRGGSGVRGGGGVARRRGEGGSPRRRRVLCGAPRPPPPRREDAQTGRGERGARGGRPGVPTSAPGHRSGRGRGACRRSLFVQRGAGRGGGQAALSSPGGDSRSRVGSRWRDRGHQCAYPLPERPTLTLRSYCGRSAATLGRSASDKAPRGLVAAEATTQRARRTICGRGLQPPGPPFFMFVMVWRRPPGLRELGEAGERRPSGVGLPAVSHGPFQPPKPYRPPAPAVRAAPSWSNRGAWKVPGRDAAGPRLSQGERRSQERREARRRNPALRQGSDLLVKSRSLTGTTTEEARCGDLPGWSWVP